MTSEALLTLRENDPHQTWIEIDLYTERDAVIARALEQNQFVSHIQLRPAQRNANWDHLFRVLATRRNLVHFVLFDHRLRAPAERSLPILQAIQQNASVRFVELGSSNLNSEDLCSFLDAAVHVTDLTLNRCVLTGGEHGARDVAAALQRNTSIVSLKLSGIDDFLVPILEGLVSNCSVRQLVVSSRLEEVRSNALQGLLESTRSIQCLELSEGVFREQSWRPIAQGLIDSSTVEDITFQACSFVGERSIHPLNDILERKMNLRALAFKDCNSIIHPSLPQFLEVLFLALRRPASPLRHFRYEDRSINSLSNQSFSNLCQAVAESKLESFSIGRLLYNQSQIQSLADTIPFMKIRTLVIRFQIRFQASGYHDLDQHMKQTLHQAVKNNFTLQSVKYQYGDDDQFDASAEDDTMKLYLQRNIRLAQWVEDPATVPKHLWKEATTLAAKAGPETLFRLLRKIGPEVLPVGGRGRKRKRIG